MKGVMGGGEGQAGLGRSCLGGRAAQLGRSKVKIGMFRRGLARPPPGGAWGPHRAQTWPRPAYGR